LQARVAFATTHVMSDEPANPQPASDITLPALPLDELVGALSRSPLFRDVEAAQLRLLAFSAEVKTVSAGERIAAAGTSGAPAFLVSSGRITVGDETVGPGALLNVLGAMSTTVTQAVITAKTDARLLVIDHDLVSRLIVEYPEMGRAMMRSLGLDLRGLARGLRAQTRDALVAAQDAGMTAAS